MSSFVIGLGVTLVVLLALEWFMAGFIQKIFQAHADLPLPLTLQSEREENKNEKLKGREVIMNATPVESAEWLNKLFERIFLSCRDSADVKQSMINSLNHEFNEIQRKTKLLDKLVVQSFDLGMRAPDVWAVNVEKTESIAAADLSVIAYLNYIGQLSLGIEVGIILPSPIGLINVKAKVTIVQISAKVRLKLFLQELNPYFSLSLTEDPLLSLVIDFAYGDKDKIPPKIVENSVRSFIKTAVNKVLVEPNGKLFPLNDEMILDEKKGRRKKLGRLQLFIKEAADLAIADRNGLSDPYCVAKVGREEKRTKIIPKNLNPKWNQTLYVDVYEGVAELSLLVFDHDLFSKNDFLGEVVVPLSAITETETLKTEPLQSNVKRDNGIKAKGTITYSVKFEAEGTYKEEERGQKLTSSKSMDMEKFVLETVPVLGVEVKEAKDLFASDSNGFSDPYCVVTVGSKAKKTKTIQKNLSPKWNQKFAFTTIEDSAEGIHFSVFDWDFGTKDDFLGTAFVPFSELETDAPVTKVLPLQPRENHPQDNYVKGTITVRLTLEKVSAAQKEIWRKAYLGGAERQDSKSFTGMHPKEGSRDDELDHDTDEISENRASLDRQSEETDSASLIKPAIAIESPKSVPESPKGKSPETNLKQRGTISKIFHRSSQARQSLAELSSIADEDTISVGSKSDKRISVHSFDMGSSMKDSDSNSLHSLTGTVILSGTLHKLRSGIIKKWQPRGFELRDNTLRLHDLEAVTKSSKTLVLSDVTKIEPVPEKKFGKKHVLLLETKDKSAYFQTSTDADFILLLQHIGEKAARKW